MQKRHTRRSDLERISEIARECVMSPRRFGLFLGAGASAEAKVPLWNKLRDLLLEEMYNNEQDEEARIRAFQQKLQREHENEMRQRGLDGTPPETVALEYMILFGKKRLSNRLEKYLGQGKKPTSGHRALRRLAEMRVIDRCITVNIDELVERSFAHDRDHKVIVDESQYEAINKADNYDSVFQLLKLHGTYTRSETLCIDLDSVSELSQEKRLAFQEYLTTHKIVFLGYKGADKDIKDAILGSRCEQANKKGIYFVDIAKKNKDQKEILDHFKSQPNHLTCGSEYFLRILAKKVTALQKRAARSLELGSHSSLPDTEELLKKRFSTAQVIVSSPGSCIIAGDYGCHVNGKMIQMNIPVRLYIGIERLDDQADVIEASHYDPLNGRYTDDAKDGRNEQMTVIAKKTLDYLRSANNSRDSTHEAIRKFRSDYNITDAYFRVVVANEMFSNIGLGDNMIGTLVAALMVFLDKSAEYHEEMSLVESHDRVNTMANVSCILDYEISYSTTSYLRDLPIYIEPAVGSPLVLLNRKRVADEMPKSESYDFFSKRFRDGNRRLTGEKILSTAELLAFPLPRKRKSGIVDMSIAECPRTLIRGARRPWTGEIVDDAANSQNRQLFQGMADLTERVENLLKGASFHPDGFGELISRYQDLLRGLKRSNKFTDDFVARLAEIKGVVGAKVSGAGPGGAVLIFSSKRADFEKIRQVAKECQHEMLLTRIRSDEPEVRPLWLHRRRNIV